MTGTMLLVIAVIFVTSTSFREVTLTELRDSMARTRELAFRTRGSPPPIVHWLKDGAPLYPRWGLRIQDKRRRSKVVIASARPEDNGRYEGVAQSTSGYRVLLAAQLIDDNDIKVPETRIKAVPVYNYLSDEHPTSCDINEYFTYTAAASHATCADPEPYFFIKIGMAGCVCKEGFVRDSNWACIKKEDCPFIPGKNKLDL